MSSPDRETATAAMAAVYGKISQAADMLGEAEALRPSRCAGWAVLDVLYHQLLDARRALVTLATPSMDRADTDYVSYWRAFSPTGGQSAPGAAAAARHVRHVRIAASAYDPGMLAREWRENADAAVRTARSCPHAMVATQGHTLALADFIATLAVEAAIHYLDMTVALPKAPEPDPASLSLTRNVLDALAGSPLPDAWDDMTCALKGTGRLPISPADRVAMGPVADRLPLFG